MKKPELTRFLALSLLVYLEVLGFACLLAFGTDVSPSSDLKPLMMLSRYYGWFLLGAALTVFAAGPHPVPSPRLRGRYLLWHLFFLAASALILFGIGILVRPLAPDHPIVDFLAKKGILYDEFSLRFGIPSLILFSCLHATLVSATLQIGPVTLRYVLAVPLIILLRIVHRAATTVLWKYLITGVARLAYLFLSFLGFRADLRMQGDLPVVGTDVFQVVIAWPCSGLEGISTFIIGLAVVFLIHREKMHWKRTLAVAYIGIFLMYVANVIRIVVMILIGHYYDPAFARELWHSEGSTVFYAVVIVLIIGSAYGWMQKGSGRGMPEFLLGKGRAINPE